MNETKISINICCFRRSAVILTFFATYIYDNWWQCNIFMTQTSVFWIALLYDFDKSKLCRIEYQIIICSLWKNCKYNVRNNAIYRYLFIFPLIFKTDLLLKTSWAKYKTEKVLNLWFIIYTGEIVWSRLHIIISKLFGTANKYLYAAIPAKAHNSWQIVQYQSSIINTIQYSTHNSIFNI